MKNIVIAGAGIAGLNAAKAARDKNPECNILLIDSGDKNTYTRTRLPEYISGEASLKDLFPYDDIWFAKNKIQLFKNTHITGLDTQSRTVLLDNGIIKYDALVITTGGCVNVPPFPGTELENVITVRGIEDADKVKELSRSGKVCTIIGGGLLGLEIGWAIKQTGCEVNIVEGAPRLLPRQIDEQGADLLLKAISDKGIHIYLNAKTKEIVGDGKADCVKLEDGTIIPSDFIILSTGVKANILPFQNSGLIIPRFIAVNTFMETNINQVYAAGDVAEMDGKNFSIWPIAMAQGKVAGHNAALDAVYPGEPLAYSEIQPFTNLKIKGISLFSIGNIACSNAKIITYFDEAQNKYIRFFMENNQITASILFGEPTIHTKVKNAVEQKRQFNFDPENVSVEDIIQQL